MTKQAMMDADGNIRKLSVPKICHIDAGEQNESVHKEVTVADKNKLFKRRMQLRESEMDAQTHLQPSVHGRSVSFRNRPRPKLLNVDVCRPRRSSLPSPSANFLSVSYDNIPVQKESTSEQQPLRRVRSFKTTSKGGIVNRGDSFKRSANSINSNGSVIPCEQGANNALSQSRQRIDSTHSKDSGTAVSNCSSLEPDVFKVAILGDKGVGKTSLTNQFMTSEFVAFENDQDVNDSESERHVTVLLNSEESTLDIVDKDLDKHELSDGTFDAFAVVYSITDRVSYQSAVDILYDLRHELSIKDKPAIMIANKIDLVRKRKVSKEEARSVAKQYNCKYCETSAALNHHVDELLVGILSQIRLNKTPGLQMDRPSFMEKGHKSKMAKCSLPGPKRLLNFLFKNSTSRPSVHECENLFSI
ncbi:GTP-binding protein REM 1-like [Dreissena polymorpha]|uniref:GTP-binding protein RAD n=1 Tax=Dreissena polymorpha TaxID=45954 RepID=A0A9D4HBT9_DREPO|nr:GTP-binding protein REM 1-like [Dreissena polymorpha]KAH3714665.1 hypothetical protein DPMN_057354 [Dreissena polymorpha]